MPFLKLASSLAQVLGRDPKPFPPPVKLCREMVDAMGGSQSQRYQQFQTLVSMPDQADAAVHRHSTDGHLTPHHGSTDIVVPAVLRGL